MRARSSIIANSDIAYKYLFELTMTVDVTAVIDEMSASYDSLAASERFARKLHKTKQDGILVFLSIDDRVVYISTGSGVQRKLTKQVIDNLISDMKTNLKLKEYGRALERVVTQISLTMSGKSSFASRISPENTVGCLFYAMIAIFACAVGGWALYKKREVDQLKKDRR